MRRLSESTHERLQYIWTDVWPVVFLVIGLAAALGLPWLSARKFGSNATWPNVSANFSATCLAFLIGLAWDRRQRTAAERREAAAEERAHQAELEAEQERRRVEAKRRFGALALELERLKGSIERAAQQGKYKYFFPDLPTGAWRAASGPLGLIVSNYRLIADLATFYGQVDELQWRLRFKAEPGVDAAGVNPIIDALVEQMRSDAERLLAQVRKQTSDPDVASVDAPLTDGVVVARRQLTRAIRSVTTTTPVAGSE